MTDRLSGAIEELELQLQEQMVEVVNTKKLINSLLKRMGQEPRYGDVQIEGMGAMRNDEYYGKPLATAVQMYLERRRHAVTAEEILKGLEQGGFNFKPLNWSENSRLRNLAISMAKNNKAFHKLPNNTFGLTAWYDSATINAAKREKADSKEAAAEASTGSAGE